MGGAAGSGKRRLPQPKVGERMLKGQADGRDDPTR